MVRVSAIPLPPRKVRVERAPLVNPSQAAPSYGTFSPAQAPLNKSASIRRQAMVRSMLRAQGETLAGAPPKGEAKPAPMPAPTPSSPAVAAPVRRAALPSLFVPDAQAEAETIRYDAALWVGIATGMMTMVVSAAATSYAPWDLVTRMAVCEVATFSAASLAGAAFYVCRGSAPEPSMA